MRLGVAVYDVLEATTNPGPVVWSGQTTWNALTTQKRAARHIAIEFVSPTCFSRSQVDGRQGVELFPGDRPFSW